jgi:hypothetical protein
MLDETVWFISRQNSNIWHDISRNWKQQMQWRQRVYPIVFFIMTQNWKKNYGAIVMMEVPD